MRGRSKSDVLDCQWIRKLHSFGLLSGSFCPEAQIRKLRTYMRLKDNLVVESTQAMHHMQKAREFYTHTPGNNPYLVNYRVIPLGAASLPPCLMATDNRAFEANILQNHPDYSFYTSERNDGHENRFCHNRDYDPDEARPSTARELWRRWQFVYTGNTRVPCWIVRVPKEIIRAHGGLWSDNSVAMLAALFRIQFPITAAGSMAPPPLHRVPNTPNLQHKRGEQVTKD